MVLSHKELFQRLFLFLMLFPLSSVCVAEQQWRNEAEMQRASLDRTYRFGWFLWYGSEKTYIYFHSKNKRFFFTDVEMCNGQLGVELTIVDTIQHKRYESFCLTPATGGLERAQITSLLGNRFNISAFRTDGGGHGIGLSSLN